MKKIGAFEEKAKEVDVRKLAKGICATYKSMGITLTKADESRIRDQFASGIHRNVLTGGRVVCSVSKEEK